MQAHRFGYVVAGVLVVVSSLSLWSLLSSVTARPRAPLPLQAQRTKDAQTLAAGAGTHSAQVPTRVALPTDPPLPPPSATAPSFWHPTDGPPPPLAGLQNGFISDPRHVRLDRDAITRLEIGSLVPIELPGGERFLARVQHITAHDNGDRSWSGHLDGFDLAFPVIYTQGDVATFGTIATPLGLYALEAIGDDAVLYRDQRAGLQRSDAECQVLPG